MLIMLTLLGVIPRMKAQTKGERVFTRAWLAMLDAQIFMLVFAVIAARWFDERLSWISVLSMVLIGGQMMLLTWLLTAQHFSDGPASARASEKGGEAAPGDE